MNDESFERLQVNGLSQAIETLETLDWLMLDDRQAVLLRTRLLKQGHRHKAKAREFDLNAKD